MTLTVTEWVVIGSIMALMVAAILYGSLPWLLNRPTKCSVCSGMVPFRELQVLSSYFLIAYQYGWETGDPVLKEGEVPKMPWPSGVLYCRSCQPKVMRVCERGFGFS